MDKTTKIIINKTIEREYYTIADNFDKVLNKNEEWSKDYDKYSNEMDNIVAKLEEVVPKEHKELVQNLINISLCFSSVESKMLFKEGVVLGATELNYFGEVGAWLNFI